MRVIFKDDGPGISEGNLEKIFNPFFTTKEVGKGTGLGLSTTRNIVHNHGGFMIMTSEPGRGTEFRIYLPAARGVCAAEVARATPALPGGHGELILLVDDDAAVRQMSKTTLETYGYRVLLANDGAEALALFTQRSKQIDLVMTDMAMPYIDGPTTIRALKRMDSTIKIVAASGLDSDQNDNHNGSAQPDAFVRKPYSVEDLLVTLRNVLHAA